MADPPERQDFAYVATQLKAASEALESAWLGLAHTDECFTRDELHALKSRVDAMQAVAHANALDACEPPSERQGAWSNSEGGRCDFCLPPF